ncbi:MAG: thioesterase family protein [Pseudomonadota bacterium]|nr:thioesterase family protein [Pseudomonadota bacterium]
MSFAADTAIEERDGALSAEVARNWEVWGPNGGYLAAIALRAAGSQAPQGHRPAGLSCQYLRRGLFGPARLEVATPKPGRSAACHRVEMIQDEQRTLSAQIWTVAGGGGAEPAYCELAMPAVAPPEALDPPAEDPGGMTFWRNFDLRIASAARSGRPDPRGARTERWVRFRRFEPTDDPFLAQARALLLIDTMLWPAHWSRYAGRLDYVGPSLDVSVWFHADSGADDWLLIEAAAPQARDGLIYGEGRVWSRDGRLIASGASNMLVIAARPRA